MAFKEKLAKNISDHIKYSGKTKAQIAKELGVRHTAISKYALGQATPTIENLIKLCEILNCTYDDLLGNIEDRG